ncbi:hypothetical protein SKAU_G00038440 [Synaphobranchus kaupii]|uniref:Fibronectin type-III domain-containing protein n=1 Tax=Synaphobranchus kaupii TaxID=118154 RepID=A0A9Q1JDW7_SYNKA|nr:hypothetical protein SKAU_G00038440 [Synaphobranchus kaupii]
MIQWQPPPEAHQNGPLQGYVVRYCLAGLPVGYQFRNITNPDQTNLLLEDLIIWTSYEIEVGGLQRGGAGHLQPQGDREWTLQGVPTIPPWQRGGQRWSTPPPSTWTWSAPSPQFGQWHQPGLQAVGMGTGSG